MSEGTVYSDRLGAIRDGQFAEVCARHGLGTFVRAEPTTSGLFGQNVFVFTSDGAFVLRGAPHWVMGPGDTAYRQEDRWQFSKERWFAQQLHARTKVPVPWPMVHDQGTDIFGWPYLIMPKMPGQCFDEREIVKALDADGRHGVAVAMGENLSEMQRLTWDAAGDFSTTTIAFEARPESGVGWIAREALGIAATCGDRLTADERAWIERVAADAPRDAPNTYAHCDYKHGNLTVMQDGSGRWRVSGLFDFHEARFADGTLDIVRTACSYLDTEPHLARVFRDGYGKPLDPTRMTLYVLNDRLKLWEYFTRPDAKFDFLKGKTFRPWVQRYLDGILALC
jgi:aminoglycoside phosphotransferase (APT) family kinase protein